MYIIIINKTSYFLLLFQFFWDGVPVKVFESIWKSIWNTFEKYLHLLLKKVTVFVFAFEKFRSICIYILLKVFDPKSVVKWCFADQTIYIL